MQRNRFRGVLLALQGRHPLDVADFVCHSRGFVHSWEGAYRDGSVEAVR